MATYEKAKNKMYHKIAAVFGYYFTTIQKSLKTDTDLDKFYSVITSDDLLNKRDYFYTCFKNETTADIWWGNLMDQLDKKWEEQNEENLYISFEDAKSFIKEAFS